MPEEKRATWDGLGATEKSLLKQIARDAISCAIKGKTYSLPGSLPQVLEASCGAFVTLTAKKRLRGCIGHITAAAPLADTVRTVAVAAALEDPRFPPVTAEEWAGMELEISVMTPLERVENMDDIMPGTHGLYIRKGYQSGLLLPQVATEYGWDRIAFLEQTCRKAGLGKNDWTDTDTEVYWFTAQVF